MNVNVEDEIYSVVALVVAEKRAISCGLNKT